MGADARTERTDAIRQGQADPADESSMRSSATSVALAARDLGGHRSAVENNSSGESG